jgi:hypothetical protein
MGRGNVRVETGVKGGDGEISLYDTLSSSKGIVAPHEQIAHFKRNIDTT